MASRGCLMCLRAVVIDKFNGGKTGSEQYQVMKSFIAKA